MGEFNLVEVACIVYDILDYADDNKGAVRKEIDEVKAQLEKHVDVPYHKRGHEDNERILTLNGVITELEKYMDRW